MEFDYSGLLDGAVLASGSIMIRSELITRIAEQNPHLYAKDVEGMVDAILDRIAEALTCGDRVELRDFGTFSVRKLEARSGRNPRTGAVVAVEAKKMVHFKPGKAMRERLNQTRVEPEPEAEMQRGGRARYR